MDIKRMHDMIETLTECAKHEFDKGVENIDTKEMGEVIDMIKDLAEAEYYRKISIAMDEAEYGEDYDYEGRKGYRGQPRDSRGRYTSRRGRRMGYVEPKMPNYDMADMDEVERMRDMDKNMGRMYYGDEMQTSASNRDMREGRSGQMRKTYMETKEAHKANTPEDKQTKMRELEKYIHELSNDVIEMINDATQEEKNLLKQKMSALMSKI